jgi:hypothetical protein
MRKRERSPTYCSYITNSEKEKKQSRQTKLKKPPPRRDLNELLLEMSTFDVYGSSTPLSLRNLKSTSFVIFPFSLAVAGVMAGFKAFDGGRMGSSTKAQKLKVTACAWVEVVAAVVLKRQTFAVAGTPALAPKVGKIGAGDTMAVKL